MNGIKKITMGELARLAGVDISTVSRALNGSPLVKANTREQILKIANETGYVINASARNLRRQSSQTIGIVIPMELASGQQMSDPFFLEMVGAVSIAAAKRNYDLIVNIPQDPTQIAERRLLQTGRADGLIVIGQAGRSKRLKAIGPLAQNVVVWGGQVEDTNYTLVGSDNVEGGRLAVQHLFDQGRRRVLFLGDINLPEVKLRYDGLAKVYQANGLSHDPELLLKASFGNHDTFRLIVDYIDQNESFDAIFAASDVLAMAAIHALKSKRLTIPEDVAVVGYDNIGQSSMMTPSLTTIDQNISLGGEMMVELLLAKLDGKEVQSQLTPTKLVIRNSSVS